MLTPISKLILLLIISVYFSNNVFAETVEHKTNFSLSESKTEPNYRVKNSKTDILIANSQPVKAENYPSDVIMDRVTENLAHNLNINKEEIKVKKVKSKNWSDGCLELGKDDEFCIQVIVEGWQITLEDQENNTWIYHTNNDASIIRLNDKI